jgi:SAM-dependent methyltransferase
MTATAPSSFRREVSSFRDPSGFLFWRDGSIYRYVAPAYARQFDRAQASGLYAESIEAGRLLPFELVEATTPETAEAVAILKPRQLVTVTYPYEWSFGQLKDAATLTLELHLAALKHDMLLKDASAYNVQFVDGRACFIDHLSFDLVSEHGLWPAYGQFCRHFLAPLALMAELDLTLGRLAQLYLDGIPLDVASSLLPRRTWLRPGLALHLHLHARMIRKHSSSQVSVRSLSPSRLSALADSLLALVRRLSPKHQATEWGAYYADTNYSDAALEAKKHIVLDMVKRVAPKTVWDVGSNNGFFSHAVRDFSSQIICMDIDFAAVDQNYERCKRERVKNVMPLVADISNPSPGIGFGNRERLPLEERSRPDLIMALALVHHLVIARNIPFGQLARYFAARSEYLIIEYVPKSDSQVQRLLLNRKDVFDDYSEAGFRSAYSLHFDVIDERPIPSSQRTLFLMRRKSS